LFQYVGSIGDVLTTILAFRLSLTWNIEVLDPLS